MERNPNFTKEKADFVFNKIQKYFEQNAYRLALSEIISNRELLGSVLNIGSQLKLNKIFSQSVVNLMLDAFEVDGDLSRFNELFSQNQTVLELHTEQKTFELLNKYYNEKDSNPNFKSKTQHYDNKSVPPDDSIFPEEGAVQISIKSSSAKLPEAIDIERDFLDSIESPSFHHSPLSEDEMKDDGEIIKSNIDTKAIHADFFDSIRPPNMSSSSILPSDDYEQIAFDDKLLEPTQKEKITKEKSQVDAFEPISIEKTILGKKEDDTVQALRAKIQSIEAKASGKTEEPPQPSYTESIVKERREIVENGEVRTETINKSGGKVTEITLDNYEFSEYHAETESNEDKKSNKKSKKKKKQPADVEEIKKEIESLKAEKPRKKQPAKAQKQKKSQEQRPRRKRKRELNYPFIALIAVVALLLLFGGYKAVSYFSNKAPNTQSQKQPSENKPSDKDKDKQNPGSQAGNQTTTPPAENKPKYILPTDEREITDADFEGMTKAQVRLALNEMFARHGWNFGKNGELYDYFSKQSWYKPDMSMTSTAAAEKKFNEFEKKNLHILKEKFNSM